MPTHPATRATTWQSLLARSWCVGSSDHVATQSIPLECGPCALTFSYGRKSSNPSWLVSPALIADRRKSSPPWINIISSSAKSFTKPLKQLALQSPEPQTSCRQPHKNRPSARQHVVVHASVRSLNCSDDAACTGTDAGTVVVARVYGGLKGTRKKRDARLQVNPLKCPNVIEMDS